MSSPPPLPDLADDILREVFLRLPPDEPACLLRACLACKRWRRIIADPAFRGRHWELHRTPSVVGFLRVEPGDMPYVSCFVSNDYNPAASGCPAARDIPGRLVLDCRHGRVLSLAPSPSLGAALNYDLVVWDPLTEEQRCLPRLAPSPNGPHFNAAVLCSAAAEGCDHRSCHGGPFRVIFVWSRTSIFTSARVYCSETGNWSEPISVQHPNVFVLDRMPCPSTLVGDALYFRFGFVHALEYKLGKQGLSIIHGPPQSLLRGWAISLMSMEDIDGGLGCMDVEEDESSLRLRLWSRDAASRCDVDAGWTRGRAIDLEKLLPDGAFPPPSPVDPHSRIPSTKLLGLVEGTDVIFVCSLALNHPRVVYMVQFNSGRVRKVLDLSTRVAPNTSFCIPVIGAPSTT